MSINIQGEGREAVILKIVCDLALSEAKTVTSNGLFSEGAIDREWLSEAFTFARSCVDGPTRR